MKKQNKWITAAAVLGVSASLAVAGASFGEGREGGFGHGHGRGHGMRHHGAMLGSKLNLTDAQKEQWKAIRKSSFEQNKAFFEQSHQTRQDLHAAKKAGDTAKADSLKPILESQHAQMKQIREAQEQQFTTILTAEQRAQYDTLKAERAARREQRRNQQQ